MKNALLILAILATLVSCNQSNDKKGELEKLKTDREILNTKISKLEAEINPNQQKVEKAVQVKTSQLVTTRFNHFVEIQGVVDGDQNVSVSPQIGGVVTNVYVREGSLVKKGQIMATLDAEVLKQSVEEVRTQLDMANIIFEKQKNLWDKKIGSEVQFLQAKTSKESLERRIKTMQEQVSMANVVSPISGSVESVPLKVGQMASPGLPNSVIMVINMSTAKITAEVSENFASRIKNGNEAFVRFPDLGKEIESKLSFTSRFIDPSNRTFKVECRFSTHDIELRANMIAYVKIKDYTNEAALVLPINLIQSNQSGKFVYVAAKQGDKFSAVRKIVTTGMDYNGQTEIISGLTIGDQVITAGYQNLKEGEAVIF
ncbi:MAG: efflux RND transporter periplasmic adaptor subunit [Prolixibacteraceae bacterium]|jgi:RND family efflux transporter MFP subunit|nr:efflux RND transporter periplasmic adaptor subunit [Prolixibacteraceae bacterium]